MENISVHCKQKLKAALCLSSIWKVIAEEGNINQLNLMVQGGNSLKIYILCFENNFEGSTEPC